MFTQSEGGQFTEIENFTLNIVPSIKSFFISYLKKNSRLDEINDLTGTDLLRWNPPSGLLRILDIWILEKRRFFPTNNELQAHAIEDSTIDEMCEAILIPPSLERGVKQRIRFGKWLRKYLGERVTNNTEEDTETESPHAAIFNCLVNGQQEKAITKASQHGLYNLSLLISIFEASPGGAIQTELIKQVECKGKYESADKYHLKILHLLSGMWKPSEKHLGSCLNGLDRLQILGIIIWYWCTPSNSLDDAMEMFACVEKENIPMSSGPYASSE